MSAPAPKVPDGQTVTGGRRKIAAGWVIGLCLAVFTVATYFALVQPPRPDPFKAASIKDKFIFPYEENAFTHLSMVSGNLNGVFVTPTRRHIWAVGDGGLILVSRDKGRSWTQRQFPTDARFPAPAASKKKASLNLFGWGTRRANAADPPVSKRPSQQNASDIRQQYPVKKVTEPLSKKLPGKQPEPAQPTNTPHVPENAPRPVPDLRAVFFVDDDCGWIVGENATILSTTDGGLNWTRQSGGEGFVLHALHFTDRGHGWACGQSGTLLSTTDGGRSWQAQASGTSDGLNAIYFTDRGHGWACGQGGTILSTTDGGQRWHTQPGGAYTQLNALHFADNAHGWTCGDDGAILSTTDGGRNWQVRPSGTSATLYALHFVDSTHGWACGRNGTLLLTDDGGRTWQMQSHDAVLTLAGLHFADRQRGWVCGADGTILSTTDGGQTWHMQARGTLGWLHALYFTDSVHGWACGRGGTILSTADGGRRWQARISDTSADLNAVYFTDRAHGWTCGHDGTILSTTDGGQRWRAQVSGTSARLRGLFFIDPAQGWASGVDGTILSTRDGGLNWQVQYHDAGTILNAIYFTDREYGWACGQGGTILSTTDGGQSWHPQSNPMESTLYAIHFTDRQYGWACGSGGTILSTDDGGRRWQGQASGTSAWLSSVSFADREHGWAGGAGGTILSTTDGGGSWQGQASGAAVFLNGLYFTDRWHGWSCGFGGTILSTTNGGRIWTSPTYRRLPAPWYWSLCLALIVVSLFVVQRRGRPEAAGETVADLLASDRPLEAGDPDPLDLGRIAAGMARFIANRHTDPPLTMAVTGEWGTGKSSLMNLLFHDLKRRRFRPVWFNAWHHQKGEQLLASLYAHIRRQAIPPLWHPGGILFRLRLLFRRGRRNRLAFAALAFLLFAAYPFLEGLAVSLIGTLGVLLQALLAGRPAEIRQLFSLSDLVPTNPDDWIGALLASPAVAAAWRGIRAFGLSPQRLLALGTGEGGRKGGLDPGARARFAQEFEDVAASLDLGAMVIFIDDLDRCTKENVVEILETINFLAVSGRCFMILGMARQWVETCVALQFKELAEETGNGNDRREDGVAHRRRFARHYLEKLINIEVPVPVPSPDAARALLTPQAPEPATPLASFLAAIGRTAKKQAPVVCLAALALLAWYLWRIFPGVEPQPKPDTEALLVLPAATGSGAVVLDDGRIRIPLDAMGAPPGSRDGRALEIVLKGSRQALEEGLAIGTLGGDERQAQLVLRYAPAPDGGESSAVPPETQAPSSQVPEERPAGKADFHPGAEDASQTGPWLALLAGLGLAVIGGRYLVQRPRRFTEDSKTFRNALAIWHPWIVLVRRTPRTIKRFLNRLRYVAMRLRSEPENLSLWERIGRRFDRQADEAGTETRSGGVPEPVLVALGAIYHVNPKWVEDEAVLRDMFAESNEDLMKRLEGMFSVEDMDSATLADIATKLKAAVKSYQETFDQDVDALILHREAFLAVLEETGM